MFTLKLYRHVPENPQETDPAALRRIMTKILTVDHVESIQIGKDTLEVRAFDKADSSLFDYDTYYVGKREDAMTAINADNHWEWGLLENSIGKTTEHFRPHTYG